MKRFSKLKTKKGFTLLETLLATCILVIIGSMLMEGFITAMGYSYNSSVYSRSAAYNSQLCVQQMADWSVKADVETPSTKLENPYYEVGKWTINNGQFTNKRQLVFTALGTVNVAVFEEKNVSTGEGNLSHFTAEKIKNNANAVADNRTILFYYPTYIGSNPDSENYFGNTHVYLKNGTSYWWGYDKDGNPNDPVLVAPRTNTTPES